MHTDWTAEQIDSPHGSLAVRVLPAATASHSAPIVLHLHGGGSLDDGFFVARLLAEAGAVVVSPDYPAGNPFPGSLGLLFNTLTRLHDTRARWSGRAARLFVAGEETGGNLAAGLALMARDRHSPPLAGQILFSPMLDPGMGTCSIRAAEAGAAGCKWAGFWHRYLGNSGAEPHPYAAPATASRLAGLAPALVLTAADDPMHDESLRYAERLRASGTDVTCQCLAGPSRWPDALSRPADQNPIWRDTVRRQLADFLAAHARPASRARH